MCTKGRGYLLFKKNLHKGSVQAAMALWVTTETVLLRTDQLVQLLPCAEVSCALWEDHVIPGDQPEALGWDWLGHPPARGPAAPVLRFLSFRHLLGSSAFPFKPFPQTLGVTDWTFVSAPAPGLKP